MRFRRLLHCLFPFCRRSRPEDIPQLLDEASLAGALEEARRLHQRHRVDVQPLSPGEIPLPRRADPPH